MKSHLCLVMCMARPEAVSQPKPGPIRSSQARPTIWLHEGFGLAWGPSWPGPGCQAAAWWTFVCVNLWVDVAWFFFIFIHRRYPDRHRPFPWHFVCLLVVPSSPFLFAWLHIQCSPLWCVFICYNDNLCVIDCFCLAPLLAPWCSLGLASSSCHLRILPKLHLLCPKCPL